MNLKYNHLMKLKTLFLLNAVVGAVSALTAILFGEEVLSMYGVDSNPAASLMGQYSALGTTVWGANILNIPSSL
jgi:hypothetical protein